MPEGVCSGDGRLIKYCICKASGRVENCLNQCHPPRSELIFDDKQLCYGISRHSKDLFKGGREQWLRLRKPYSINGK